MNRYCYSLFIHTTGKEIEMDEVKKRQVSDRSLENLKLGAQSRYQGKLRHNFTVLPETVQWLKGTGNASDAIDSLVEAAKKGNFFSNNTHERKDEEVATSDNVYKQKIKELEVNLEEMQLELSKTRLQLKEAAKSSEQCVLLERENKHLQQQASDLRDHAQKVSCQLPALEDEVELLRSEIEHLKNQPTATGGSDSNQEVINLLKQAIIPKSKGGEYLANNAKGLRTVVEQVLKKLTSH